MKALVWAAIDTLSCLLLIVLVAINPPVVKTRASIATPGKYVVVMTWPQTDNDVDLWLRQPDGRIVYWRNPRSPLAHLESDDQGFVGDLPDGHNVERMVLRNLAPGEFTVNVHLYSGRDVPVPVTVTLWRLEGVDAELYSVKIVLAVEGDEVTAFRFSPNEDGAVRNLNRLPAQLVHY